MSVRSEIIEIKVGSQSISGSIVTPCEKFPGILFVHGWGGSQQRDLARAKNITGLGCVCLTFDLRGHERTEGLRAMVSREQSLEDLLAAYDRLVSHPSVDPEAIAVIGTSYGGYLATILSAMRPVKWMALRVPALYWDADWDMPKQELDRDRLAHYRRSAVTAADNRALAACKEFRGDVLLIESERDDYVPHATLMSYRSAFELAHSLTYRLVDGADHALSSDISQSVYSSMLTNWISEMVIGARLVDYPHHSAKYS
ncbi:MULTISPECIES: alpha/beta hydrolase family protein [Pseudomonas syringae group]|uniref:Dipeptidyl aminopeptidase/acylaminoacyl-peptidase-like protein n=1 Tax=Pseudomonas syringae pv. primulae TaxID=251707 RepID=A0A0Q0AU51_9PSED|nr:MULTISPECIES: alpha/beta fold hydrolase [Pseudomonas syringae group]KPY37410.1 Dipeptidyl aminopeptidase/acylaminoacyl-peptidase-like protein [Pseudomonas syringae pv. primulae]MBD8202492.1 alpha/beta fold hydrolase [Pseudomonas viridiflava]MDY0935682.1 alpha/beta fold hydrolase [Pseudomonas viridiflava]MDY1013541.1 alpha/beta fold hydrolase [Pseudomonas viridiflava]TKJ63519.1 alpha/beta hydrolase [Pseudomonas viridiflava]